MVVDYTRMYQLGGPLNTLSHHIGLEYTIY
jgi:hypothetical protein